jgi:hypothetical protein
MRRCVTCRDEADEILWQPFGPAATPTEPSAFVWPGDHTRGFPALPLCAACQALLREGARVHFRYKQQWWHCEGLALVREDAPHA